jgi:hypothetical protein
LHSASPVISRLTRYGAAFFALAIIAIASDSLVQAQDSSNIQQRLDDLEQTQDEIFQQLTSEQGKVGTFLDDRLSIGGFFETAVTGIWGNGTRTQFSTTPNNLALDLSAVFSDSFRFNSQTLFTLSYPLDNSDNDPNAASLGLPASRGFDLLTTAVTVPLAYFEYGSNPEIAVQAGRGFAPFGIAYQLRDLVLFRRRGGPQMIGANANTPGNVVIASGTWSGVHLGGSFRALKGHLGYDLYTLTPGSSTGTIGGGARAWIDLLPSLTWGVSTQAAKMHGYTFEVIGTDLKLKTGRFGMDMEYAAHYSASGVGVARSYYAEPYYTFLNEKFLIYGAVDYLGNPFGETIGLVSTGLDPYEKFELGGGVNWLPFSYTRFRLGLLYNDYVGSTANLAGAERNYFSLDLSAGVEF